MNTLHKRIIEISDKHGMSHRGSNLTAVGIIDEIYQLKEDDEPFILSSGHAGLALYVVLEKYHGLDAEQLYKENGTHPNRGGKIDCSTGSLGSGAIIAAGMALADRTKNVYCLISDGESFEGTIYEVGNVMKKYNLTNLKVYCNFNGWSATDRVPSGHALLLETIIPHLKVYYTSVQDYGYKGLEAHYSNK